MTVFKAVRLGASVRLDGDHAVVRESGAVAPEWRGAQLLVAAVAAGYATELAAAAGRLEIPVRTLEVEAAGHLTSRRDDRYGIVAIEVDAVVDAAVEDAERVSLAAEIALDRCVVASALDVPLSHHVRVEQPHLREVPA
jgi:organic hydroperoxide reductase OsmC/OhrA